MNARAPICDERAEAAVLSNCILSRDAWDVAQEMLKPADFFIDAHRHVFESLLYLDTEGRPFDLVIIASWLSDQGLLDAIGGTPKLAEIIDATPSVANIAAHARIVMWLALQRRVIAAAREIVEEGEGPMWDPLEFADHAERKICNAAKLDTVDEEPTDMGAAASEFLEQAEARAARGDGLMGHRSGLAELDRRIAGWCPGFLYIIAGRPGMGKTAMMDRVVRGIVSGERARKLLGVEISLEMPRDQMAMRSLAGEARVDIMKLRTGDIRGHEEELTAAASDLGRLPLSVKFKPGATLRDVKSIVRRALIEQRQKHGSELQIGVIAVDYLQLMRGVFVKGQSKEQEVSELSRSLKEMAGEFRCPVIALSQLNRSVETRNPKDKRPQLSDLRDSGAIEQDADTVIFMYRDEYYFDDSPDRGIAEAIVAKQRNGPTGTVRLKFTGRYALFDNLASDYDQHFDDLAQPLNAAHIPWNETDRDQ